MFDWLRKRKKNRKIKTLDYLINLEERRQLFLTKQINETKTLEEKIIEKEKVKPPNLFASKNCAFVTTETDIELVQVKVLDNHKIKYKKREILIDPYRPAHILTIPLHKIIPTRLGRFFSPRFQRFRVYTFQREGEITHDPNNDKMDEEDKVKLESVLLLAGAASKADIATRIMAGMKEALGFWTYFRDILYILVIILMLFAFQIAPNMG